MEFRRPNRFSDLLEKNHKIIRDNVKKLEEDRLLKDDITAMITLVKTKSFIVK